MQSRSLSACPLWDVPQKTVRTLFTYQRFLSSECNYRVEQEWKITCILMHKMALCARVGPYQQQYIKCCSISRIYYLVWFVGTFDQAFYINLATNWLYDCAIPKHTVLIEDLLQQAVTSSGSWSFSLRLGCKDTTGGQMMSLTGTGSWHFHVCLCRCNVCVAVCLYFYTHTRKKRTERERWNSSQLNLSKGLLWLCWGFYT